MKRQILVSVSSQIRKANVIHVLVTSRLAGVEPSAFMLELFRLYKAGEISSAQVVEEVRVRHKIGEQ